MGKVIGIILMTLGILAIATVGAICIYENLLIMGLVIISIAILVMFGLIAILRIDKKLDLEDKIDSLEKDKINLETLNTELLDNNNKLLDEVTLIKNELESKKLEVKNLTEKLNTMEKPKKVSTPKKTSTRKPKTVKTNV